MSKHQEILDYLTQLEVGKRISVRGIANRLQVSEGTAYRAIKEAENRGLVETHHRSGTVRIDRQAKFFPSQLRFADVVAITGAEVVAGQAGLSGRFNQFLIGAMTTEGLNKYLKPGNLVIVGDREDIQSLVLESGNALLVTGGYSISEKMKALSNSLGLPLLVSSHDTFTLASLINQAFIKQNLPMKTCHVADIYQSKKTYGYLHETDRITDYFQLQKTTKRVRFPVVNQEGNLVGVVSLRDVIAYPQEAFLKTVMTKYPVCVELEDSLASIGQLMVAEDFAFLPVVDDKGLLLGLVTRKQVMDSLDWTGSVSIVSSRSVVDFPWLQEKDGFSLFDSVREWSKATLLLAVNDLAEKIMEDAGKKHIIIEQMMIYWLEEMKQGSKLFIQPHLSMATRQDIIELSIFIDETLVAKAMITSKVT
ncbi:DRTGG domain-containing protein [Streptococcus sp. sy004]|uniref:DRTGG domain-containing protein n=1 Tax=Streptococcus sp. sy004 TaxID=2600149 RepID=UPI0011B36909|nr:DRTGG domain-containing protein [Streptococcus sp. sy004]TWT12099.1 CBS domain-containing protein [Streptococcus sp. sy004]